MSEGLTLVPFSDFVEINPAVQIGGILSASRVSFIPMQDVSDAGEWENRQERLFHEVRSGYTRFREGDILFAKITPCMENGKGAHAVGLIGGIGFGSTEFHVLRSRSSADPRFVFHWTRAPQLRASAEARMTG